MNKPLLLGALAISVFPAFPAQAAAFRVGLVTDMGGLNDDSFNFLAHNGVKRAKADLKIKTSIIESKQQTDYEKNLSTYATGGYDLVVSVGFMMGDATKKVAERFPKTKFAIIDVNYPKPLPNVAGITFAEEQAGFLAGALAGLVTKRNTVGFVGGMDVPVIHRFKSGYEEGARSVNKNIKLLSGYTGNFTDSAKGYEVATAQYQQGADIVFHAAGAGGKGVIDSAKSHKRFAIGVDADQYKISPANVLSSALKKVDLAVFNVIKEAKEGRFQPGNRRLTLKDGAVGLAPFYEHKKIVSATAQKRLAELRASLVSGKIVVKLAKFDM